MTRKDSWLVFIISFLCSFATLMVYLPALQNVFVNFDDGPYVYENAFIRTLDWPFVRDSFLGFHYLNWHPLTMISYAVDYRLWGLDPFGYHLTNVLLHSANTFLAGVLTALLLKAGCGQRPPVFVYAATAASALLFGLHPLHVESVAWISGRKDVLSGFFFLLALISYLRYAASARKALYYTATFVLSALAMMSKPIAVTLPVVFLILDYYPLRRPLVFRTAVLEKFPFAALSCLTAVITVLAQTTAGAFTSGLAERALVSARAYFFYLWKTAVPVDLAPFYPIIPKPSLSSAEYLGSVLVLIGLAALCVTKRARGAFSAAFAFYLVTLLPVIGIVQISSHMAADRYMYLPSLALFALAGAGAGRLAAYTDRVRMAVLVPALAVFVVLSFASIRQMGIWKDSVTLWSHEAEKYPYVFLAYNNRAVAYTQKGRYMDAIEDLKRAISMQPDFVPAYINLADAFKKTGRKDLAADVYSSGVEATGANAELLFERGLNYNSMGEYAKATEDFTAVLSRGLHVDSLIYRAAALIRLGETHRASDDLLAALDADPGNPLAHHGMAEVYYKMKKTDLASYHIGRAKALGYR